MLRGFAQAAPPGASRRAVGLEPIHRYAAGTIAFDTELTPKRRCRYTGSPKHRAARDAQFAQRHSVAVDLRDRFTQEHVDAESFELTQRAL